MISTLIVENLACTRGERRLFADLSFQVAQGQALAIQGANGVGKTSLLRLLAGFLTPLSGTVRFVVKDKADISEPEERGKLVGWLGHHDGLKAQLSVAEQLAFFARLYGHPRPHAVATDPSQRDTDLASVLEQTGLTRQSALPCRYLSAGQKKRLALARLKLTNRPVWLLDEPLAALDVAGKRLAAELIGAHCAHGGMVLAATHEPLGVPAAALTLGAP